MEFDNAEGMKPVSMTTDPREEFSMNDNALPAPGALPPIDADRRTWLIATGAAGGIAAAAPPRGWRR